MRIQRVQNNGYNTNFQAKYSSFSKIPKEYLELFEKKTSDFPNMTLVQRDISRFGNDYFILSEENKPGIVAHGCFVFTRDTPENKEAYVNRLVSIFDRLRKNPLPEMHIDNI